MANLLWRLQSGRSQPIAYARADLDLASLAEGFIAYRSMGEQFGFFAESSRFFGNVFLKGKGLLETAAIFHGTTSSLRVLTAGFEFSRNLFS